ncbi:MAG: membrane fusion efflux protein [Bacteroidetes bacterium]|nr:MAG: membrane fusion efflux protein [Bacteroidota bacterium]
MKPIKFSLIILSVVVLASCEKKTEEASPVKKDVTEIVFAAGVLEANNTYNLTAQTDGYLSAINFKEGDIVNAGTVLATVENPENSFNTESANALYLIAERNTQNNAPALAQAKSNLLTAKSKLQTDSTQAMRYKTLFEKNTVSKTEYENMWLQYITSQNNYTSAQENYKLTQQQAEQQLISNKASKEIKQTLFGNNQIKAVVGGRVYKKQKQAGDYVKKGDVIATIGDPNVLYAKVNVDESNISKIKIGQKCVIQLNTDKEKNYNGTVHEILPAFDDASQSFICKLSFTDPLDFKITGTQLQANIQTATRKNVMLIPRNYLGLDGTVQIKGKKESVKIEISAYSNEFVEVVSGISESDVLVTEKLSGEKKSLEQNQIR